MGTALTLPAYTSKKLGTQVCCTLCGFGFDASQAECGGCAMVRGCSMLKCPNCHYEFVGESKIVKWFQNLFGKGA